MFFMWSNYSPKLGIKVVIENVMLHFICNGYHCLFYFFGDIFFFTFLMFFPCKNYFVFILVTEDVHNRLKEGLECSLTNISKVRFNSTFVNYCTFHTCNSPLLILSTLINAGVEVISML